jgi:hypothetical protein
MNKEKLQPVTLEQAKGLKKLGLNWECEAYYDEYGQYDERAGADNWNRYPDSTFSAPSVALALKWFRDVKNIAAEIQWVVCYPDGKSVICWYGDFRGSRKTTDDFNSFEEAESALLDKLLEIY